jgi:2-keto-4-pentenoate hydratase
LTSVLEQTPIARPEAERIARTLDAAWESRAPRAPLSEVDGLRHGDAYAVQDEWTRIRLAGGDRIIGRKIGLTSKAMRRMANVDEPDYGSLWGSRYYPATFGRAELPPDTFIQPRVEGELAFLLQADLTGGHVTPQDVMVATAAVAPSIEVVDSRIEDWKVGLADTIADNASYGGFVVGPWSATLRYQDLRTIGMVLWQNGEVVETGAGAAALDSPARAVAWLANKLHGFGIALEAGSIVLSGALSAAPDAAAGDVFQLQMTGLSPLTVSFS